MYETTHKKEIPFLQKGQWWGDYKPPPNSATRAGAGQAKVHLASGSTVSTLRVDASLSRLCVRPLALNGA